jgi:hypothetical protein
MNAMHDPGNVGMLSALQATVMALVDSHPDPAALQAAVQARREPMTAILLGLPTPEPALQAFERVMASVESTLARRT